MAALQYTVYVPPTGVPGEAAQLLTLRNTVNLWCGLIQHAGHWLHIQYTLAQSMDCYGQCTVVSMLKITLDLKLHCTPCTRVNTQNLLPG